MLPALTLVMACSLSACDKPKTHEVPLSSASATGRIRITVEPTLDISASAPDGTPVMGNVADATRLSSGSVVVADRDGEQLHMFDSHGRKVRQVGRSGGGPGEYRDIETVAQCQRDSLFVWDRMGREMSVVDSQGRFIRKFRPPGNPWKIACNGFETIAIAGIPTGPGRPDDKGNDFVGNIFVTSPTGDSVGSLDGIRVGQSRPLGNILQIAVSKDNIYFGIGDSAQIHVFALRDRTTSRILIESEARKPTPANYEAAVDELVSLLGSVTDRNTQKSMLLKTAMPETVPRFRALLTDPSGNLWIITSPLGGGTTDLIALEPSGVALGKVHIPLDLSVFEIGTDYILASYQDNTGTQHITIYRFAVLQSAPS